jgi:hypothetical protein
MSELCGELHRICRELPRHEFRFEPSKIPKNGIYVLFEKGEEGHGGERIVRIGTHTGVNQLRSRLIQHFLKPNKDRSIFRKNIGRCLLHRASDPFLVEWQMDRTTRMAKTIQPLDNERMGAVERQVTELLQANFSFATIPVATKEKRIHFESRLISTVSNCKICRPSSAWLGLNSPIERIRESGLWQVLELYKTPLDEKELRELEMMAKS